MKKILSIFILTICIFLTGCDVITQLTCAHNFDVEKIPATCTTEGEERRTCPTCGLIQVVKVPMIGHDFVYVSTTPSTCTTEGEEIKECTLCKEKQITKLPLLEHNYVYVSTIPSTCIEKGKEIKECSICKDKQETELDYTNHDYQIVSTIPSTCIEKGKEIKECSICKDKQETELDYSEHNFTVTTIPSTCIEKGKEIKECSVCKEKTEIELDYINHDYQITSITPSTCIEKGKEVKECSVCKDKQEVELDLIDHNFVTTTIPSTCTKKGKEINTCSVCNKEEIKELELLEHNIKETIIQPTCIAKGYTLRECKDCTFEEKVNFVDTVDHTYNEWKTVVQATEFSDGLKEKDCKVCSHKVQEIIISTSYTNLDVIRNEFEKKSEYKVYSYEEMQKIYDASVFNYVKNIIFVICYDVEDYSELLQKLVDNCDVEYNYTISFSKIITTISITFDYEDIATNKTPSYVFEQYSSMNYNSYNSSRTSTFDDFKINASVHSYKVKTSEQLAYVLERGAKPICEVGSPAEKMYNKMKDVLREIIDDNMTDVEKIKAIHDYIILNVTYDQELLTLISSSNNISNYNGFYLEGVFNDKKAVCEGISKAVTSLANIEGIPCVTVEGYQTNNPSGVGHAWNKVYVNNNWYIIDATSDGIIMNNTYEILSYKYFLIDEETMQKVYTGNTYKNIICNKKYDYYNNYKYKLDSNEYAYVISNQDELKNIVKFFETNTNTKKSIEFKVTFNYGESFVDELQMAYVSLGKNCSFNFTESNSIITLIR